jgi:hypothetical protein
MTGCRLLLVRVGFLGCWARAGGSCLWGGCLVLRRRFGLDQERFHWPACLPSAGSWCRVTLLMWPSGRAWYQRSLSRGCCFVPDWGKKVPVSDRLDCFCWMGEWVSSRIRVGEPNLRAVSSWDGHRPAVSLRDVSVGRSHRGCAEPRHPGLCVGHDWDQQRH